MCVEYIYHITGWSDIFPVIIIGEHIIQGLCDIWRYLDCHDSDVGMDYFLFFISSSHHCSRFSPSPGAESGLSIVYSYLLTPAVQ